MRSSSEPRRLGQLPTRCFVAAVLVAVPALGSHASTASNTVPGSRLTVAGHETTLSMLVPSPCAELHLTTVVSGSGRIKATSGSDLVLASDRSDDAQGRNGDDCILGGDGDDQIDGGPGFDVCIGGAGRDELARCEVVID